LAEVISMPLNEWEWRGGNLSTVVGSSEAILFTGPGGGFTTPLITGDTLGQEGTYVRHMVLTTSGGALPNCQFISNAQAGVGGSTVAISNVSAAESTLRIRLTTHAMGAVGTTNSFFDAYGADSSHVPADGDVSLYGFEVGNSAWSTLNYMNNDRLRLTITSVATMTHDWHVAVSARAKTSGTFEDITFRVVTEYVS